MNRHSEAASADPIGNRTPPGIRLLRLLLPVLILAAGAAAAFWLLKTGPQAKPRPPAPSATLVETARLDFGPARPVVEAMGTVVAATQVELKPRVAGQVVEMSEQLVPGGFFRAGEVMLRIDPADYELAVRQLAGEVAQAAAALRIETGNQDIARREYELVGGLVTDGDLDLMLRKPQLETARARLETASARLAQAKLALERTTVRAPFNGVVQARQVDVGARVSEATHFATLVGTDRYWVEAVVPVRELRWVQLPERENGEGSPARIHAPAAWGDAAFQEGRVIRLAADLEEHGRLGRLFIAVDDPLRLRSNRPEEPKLFIGSYVRVEIQGRPLDRVAALPREWLRDGDQVWIMDPEDRLEIRPVVVAFRGRDQVMISGGLGPEDRVVVTGLPTPVAGMGLRTRESGAPPVGHGGSAGTSGAQGGGT